MVVGPRQARWCSRPSLRTTTEGGGWGQVESSTVILTFPLISSVVPVLSGLPVFVGAVQSHLARPSQSGAAGGRGRPARHRGNEGRRARPPTGPRPDRRGSWSGCRWTCGAGVADRGASRGPGGAGGRPRPRGKESERGGRGAAAPGGRR